MSGRGRGLLLAAALVAGAAADARAQTLSDTTTSGAPSRWPITAWASAGVGLGRVASQEGNALAMVERANLSAGTVLLTYRRSDVHPPLSGDGVRDTGFLVGVRSRGRRLFAAPAIGYVEARPSHRCDCGDPRQFGPSVGAFAYDLTLHANAKVLGVALPLSGVAGPRRVRYLAGTIAVEAGWFGEWVDADER